MKNIILQHWTGPLSKLEELSVQSMKAYAEFCGAEYQLLRGSVMDQRLSNQSQKIVALTEKFDDYDTVVILDTDMFTRKGMSKNIFTDEKGIGRHYGIQESLVKGLSRTFPHLGNPEYPYFGGSIYRLEKDVRVKLRRHMNMFEMMQFNGNFNDEGIMHRLSVLEKLPINENTYLDRQQWNHSSFDDGVEDAEIIHIRPKVAPKGPKRPKIENYNSLVEKGII